MTDRWLPRDNHAHTTHSDGVLTPDEVVARARELGVLPTVSDHISRDVSRSVVSAADARFYLRALESLPDDVGRSGEFCWHDTLWRELPEDTVRRFTHRIGSLHGIFLADGSVQHAFSRTFPRTLAADAYMELHVRNLEAFAEEMPVDILAHPTLVPISLRERPLEELWTEPLEERAVDALHRAGIAFEISNRYRPHERFVRRAIAKGVRISLGSDGHTPEQVADIAAPLAMARSLGVPDAELYDPFVHGSKTGHFG